MALTKIDDRGVTYPLDILDNEKIRFGTGNDLEIYHDGSNNIISGTSNTWIKNTGTQGFTAGSDYQLKCIADGAVELYYNNSKKFETSSIGVTLNGDFTNNAGSYINNSGGHVQIGHDSGKLKLGAGQDLQIYHDGSNSYVNNTGTGYLILQGNGSDDVSIRAVNGESGVVVKPNGGASQVELYYDNVKTFETTSSGLNFIGSNADQMQWQKSNNLLKFRDGTKAVFGEGNDLQIYHSGSTSIIASASHPLAYYADTRHHFLNGDGSENVAVFTINGSCDLYYDNVKKISTQSYGVKLDGERPVLKLECTAGASNTDPRALINFSSTNANNDADMYRINFWEGVATDDVDDDAHMSLRYHGDATHGGSGSISFRNESATACIYMNRSGNGGTSGTWTVGSDSRKKENIVTVANALTKVSQLRGVDFKWKEKYGGHQCSGVIAQEVETVLPHLVDELSADKNADGSIMKAVNYDGLWGVMIEALKEAKTKIETLETKVAALEAK